MRRDNIDKKNEHSPGKENNLLGIFEEIHNYIYSHDGLSPQQALDEFVKILFIKIYDETRNLKKFSVDCIEPAELKNNREKTEQFRDINDLFDIIKREFNELFEPDDRIKLSPHSFHFAVEKLKNVSLLGPSRDVSGLAFQKMLSRYEKNSRGQFFTPEPVIDFCVKIIAPQAGENILDPACGSGGFLISALSNIIEKNSETDLAQVIASNIYGAEINKSLARISKMKLFLEININSNIYCVNSLKDADSLKRLFGITDGFDIILTNPPFGAKINQVSLLSKFDLGYKWERRNNSFKKVNKLQKVQIVEILFIERCIDLLKNGGRMAIVLPDGCIENSSLEYLRSYLLEKTKLLAVIKLPPATFIPYGTGVKTSILFLQKHGVSGESSYPVFFGRVTKPGYLGNKIGSPVYKKDSRGNVINDDKGSPAVDEDMSEIVDAYNKFKRGLEFKTMNSFSIMSTEINGRFDFDFYSPENRELIDNISANKTVKLGDICTIVKNKSLKLKVADSTVEYIELSDINAHTFEIINSTLMMVHELPDRASFEIIEGDIITAVAGNSVGTKKHSTALVTDEYSGCICTNGFRVLRDFKIDPYYILYYMKTEKFLKQMFMYRTGAAIPKVSDTFLAKIIIEIPEDEKIQVIAEKFRRAFSLRNEANREIENLINDNIKFGKS